MPVDNSLENLPMLGFVYLPIVILSALLAMMIWKKKGGQQVTSMMLFPFIGMLVGNFAYHNISDLIVNKDYARFKEGSIFGYIGMVTGLGIGFLLKNKVIRNINMGATMSGGW